jgi:hypothetical protein
MSVIKATCDRYTISNVHEYATICIVEWTPRRDSHGPIYGGEILVNSTFGAFCNSWGHCGQPFKQFLAGLNFNYFMTKCRGMDAEQFDGEKSVRNAKERVTALRRDGTLTREQAREAWDAIEECESEAEHSEYAFVRELYQVDIPGLSEPWELVVRSPTPDTVGFWRDIWPEFVAAIRAETQVTSQGEKP